MFTPISIIKTVMLPTTLISILLAVGFALLCFRRLQRIGFTAIGLGIFFFFLFGNGPFSNWLLGTLEYRYPPLALEKSKQEIKHIAVLSGYATDDHAFPLSSRVNDSTLFRIVEGVNQWEKNPTATILIAATEGGTPPITELILTLGVDRRNIQILPPSYNTKGNIAIISHSVSTKPFILVTSAGHMPRAMLLCRQAGLNPIPAPTDFITSPHIFVLSWLPNHIYLKCSDLAVHELMAILYYQYF